jgi:DNA-binding transcriptional LysR family regulator
MAAELPDLNDLSIFSIVAEEGGLTRAARRLGVPKSTISRRLSALETRLAVKLLIRTPRAVQLTAAGKSLYEGVRAALEQITEAERSAHDQGTSAKGRVRIAAPRDYGVFVCAPIVRAFLAEHPLIQVDLELSDRTVNLVEEGFDAAIRVGALTTQALVARRVGSIGVKLVASPDYLARRGTPRAPKDLLSHDVLLFGAPLWKMSRAGVVTELEISPKLSASSLEVIRDAAKGGLGVARVTDYMVVDAIARGELEAVLSDWSFGERPVHIVHSGRHLLPSRVTLFIDYMTRRLREHRGS